MRSWPHGTWPTEAERFTLQQVQPGLLAGETAVACAYLTPVIESGKVASFVSAATRMAAFAALTDRRLILVQTRIGAFKPLLENHGVMALDPVVGELAEHLVDGRRRPEPARYLVLPKGERRRLVVVMDFALADAVIVHPADAPFVSMPDRFAHSLLHCREQGPESPATPGASVANRRATLR